MVEIVQSIKIMKKWDIMRIIKIVNENKDKRQ